MLNKLKIPNQLRNKIDNELEPYESIRWIGQPNPKVSGLIIAGVAEWRYELPSSPALLPQEKEPEILSPLLWQS